MSDDWRLSNQRSDIVPGACFKKLRFPNSIPSECLGQSSVHEQLSFEALRGSVALKLILQEIVVERVLGDGGGSVLPESLRMDSKRAVMQ
ncbi:hypothetical protein VNO77_41765 [Canavalia gladiata]|uniref:Uncharacterized protein n=1 Tax=Canavalia gladiata TaxID=3824 RepID=A0AAN9K0E6_CANGL